MAGLELVLATTQGDMLQFTATDSNGYFEFRNIPDGEYHVYPLQDEVDIEMSPVLVIDGTTSYNDIEFVYEETYLTAIIDTTDSTTVLREVESSFSIFPNPTQEKLFILFTNEQPAQVQVYDAYGKEQIIQYAVEDNLLGMQLNRLTSGVYFLKVTMRSGGVEVKKFMVE
jgi:hypothetical protein